MQVPRRILFISNFSQAQQRFLKYCLWFFVPVIAAYIFLEILALQLPINYKVIGNYLDGNAAEIEVMALGSSEMKNAFNPEISEKPAINFASTSQHHNEDFEILKGTRERMPNLKYVLLEVSYNHLELPHHRNDYWKNSVYLKYYGVNAFGRQTFFKDRLLFLSNPRFYSFKLMEHYIYKSDSSKFNKYGFDTNNYKGPFKDLEYDETKIAARSFRIINSENLKILQANTEYLYKMLDYLKAKNLKVIICTVPLYKTYLKQRTPEIVKRRDSVLREIKKKYRNVYFLKEEEDTTTFTARDFLNENHLNPVGARKYTEMMNQLIDTIN